MGYVTTILRARDADRETEIACEALDGDAEDGAVLELAVTLGYGSSLAARHEGYVRLTRRHFDALAEWIGHHAEALRSAQWAEENAPKDEPTDEWLRASALLAPLKTGGSLDVVEAVAFLRSIVGGDDEY